MEKEKIIKVLKANAKSWVDNEGFHINRLYEKDAESIMEIFNSELTALESEVEKLKKVNTIQLARLHEKSIDIAQLKSEVERLRGALKWIDINIQKPPFDKKILTWNENEPDEPSRTDTLIAIEHNSKGKLYKWLENGYPTHWMPLPSPPTQSEGEETT